MHLLNGGPECARNVVVVGKEVKKLEKFELHTCVGPGVQKIYSHK